MDLAFTDAQDRLAGDIAEMAATARPWHEVVEDPAGYDRALWGSLVAHGGIADAVFGAASGRDGATTELVVAAQALGAGPVPGPLHQLVAAGSLLLGAGDRERAAQVATGRRAAVCLGDPGRMWPHRSPSLRARRQGGAFVLDGTAGFVPFAHDAELLVVLATSEGATLLVCVEAAASGVGLVALPTIGADRCCTVVFDGVRVPDTGLVSGPGEADAWLPAVVDRCRTVVAAEMAGAAGAALRSAVVRANERHQFGSPLGALQAVQHRLADAHIDALSAADAVYDAAGAADRADPRAPELAWGAKAWCNQACRRVTAAAHQVWGGEGIYLDRPVHAWHRRVAALAPVLGSTKELLGALGTNVRAGPSS